MTVRSERSVALFGIWKRVNELADVEDTTSIRNLLSEAGINGCMHVGVAPDNFTPEMVAEWVLGQWVDTIDSGALWALNTARNVSFYQYEKVVGGEGP